MNGDFAHAVYCLHLTMYGGPPTAMMSIIVAAVPYTEKIHREDDAGASAGETNHRHTGNQRGRKLTPIKRVIYVMKRFFSIALASRNEPRSDFHTKEEIAKFRR
jgi:hypothetical protein